MSDVVRTKELTIYYLSSDQINRLQNSSDLFDVILLTPPFNYIEKNKPFKYTDSHDQIDYLNNIMTWLDESVSHLDKHGAILVYGIPRWLPYFAEFLSQRMTFKYWIVLKTTSLACDTSIMQPSHDGVLLFVKDRKNFTINRVRYPHIYCSQCGDFLADWGGKKHLRPEYGPIISDIWDDRNDLVDQNNKLTPITLERLLDLTCKNQSKVLLAMHDDDPYPGSILYGSSIEIKEPQSRYMSRKIVERKIQKISVSSEDNSNTFQFRKDDITIGDSIQVMTSWLSDPQARFDLIFADPPYNLDKNYGKLDDNLKEQEYINWCDQWLELCSCLLKPYGSLYVLNLPKWSIFHATILNKKLWFQRWIAWDALSDPRGNVMPAHYGLLLYTNHPTDFTYNSIPSIPKMDQCLRPKCIASRPYDVPKEELSDIWYDVHRIKHKRDRDDHPCQLPNKLLERVIQLSTNPGDLVLDPFMGTGTTAIVAKKLGRHYIGIDIDPQYREIAQLKLNSISFGEELKYNRTNNIRSSIVDQLPLFK